MSAVETPPPAPAIRIPEPWSGVKLVGLQRDEFLFRTSTVIVETPEPMDAEAARRSIGVERAANVVTVDRPRKRATWSPPDDLPLGTHVLQVGPMLSGSNGELAPGVAIPFHLVESTGRIPKDVAIESMVRLRVAANELQTLPLFTPSRGKYVELMKGVNRRTGVPVALA